MKPRAPWDKATHDDLLKKWHMMRLIDKDIGDKMGFSEQTVQKRRNELGLKPNRGYYKCNQNPFVDSIPKQIKSYPPGVRYD